MNRYQISTYLEHKLVRWWHQG